MFRECGPQRLKPLGERVLTAWLKACPFKAFPRNLISVPPKSTAAGEGARATQNPLRPHFFYFLKPGDLDGCFWEVGGDFWFSGRGFEEGLERGHRCYRPLPSGAKAPWLGRETARLKPRPFKTKSKPRFFGRVPRRPSLSGLSLSDLGL
jgi:hypothetical protein